MSPTWYSGALRRFTSQEIANAWAQIHAMQQADADARLAALNALSAAAHKGRLDEAERPPVQIILPHGAIASRRGTDCDIHLIMPNGQTRCGFVSNGWLDMEEDDDTCVWEQCATCYCEDAADG